MRRDSEDEFSFEAQIQHSEHNLEVKQTWMIVAVCFKACFLLNEFIGSPFMVSVSGKPSGRIRETVSKQIQAAETVVVGQPCLLQLKLPGKSSVITSR